MSADSSLIKEAPELIHSPLIQEQSTQLVDSPLIQELDQSLPRIDQPTSHVHSLLIQDQSTLLADSPLVQELDQAPSLVDQPVIQEQSTPSFDSPFKTGSQTCSQAKPSPPSTTCKILDVHLSFRRGSNTKPVQRGSSSRDLKSYFKSYSPLIQHKPPTVQEQAPSQIDLHLIQELDNPFSLVDQSISESTAHSPLINEQNIMSANSSLIEEVPELMSQIHSPRIQEQSILLADSPLITELDQPLSQGDQSNSPLYSPLIQDSSMLSSDYSLINELDHPLYQDDLDEDMMITSPQNALSDDDHMDMVVPSVIEQAHLLPFPEVSVEWYKRQNALFTKNASRQDQRPYYDEGVIQYIDRSRVDGTIEDNIKELKQKMALTKDNHTKAHLSSLVKVGEFILSKGLFVKTHDTACIYGDSTRKSIPSAELYNVYSKHLNLVQVYIYNVAYLTYCPPGSNVLRLLDTLKRLHLPEDIVVNSRIQERLKVTYGKALEYMDTHRDRQVLKAVMATLTSIQFTALGYL